MAGGRHADDSRSGTPRSELNRIRESRERQAEEVRDRILAAVLVASGEKGYRGVAVQDVIDRYGGNRVQFYRLFASKGECYAEAHEIELGRLTERVLAAGRGEPEWRLGVRAGIEELAAYAEDDPARARGLLVEAHVAGGRSLALQARALERLARALDRGRLAGGGRQAPPAITGRFMAGAIEASLTGALAADDPGAFTAATPELTHMVVAAYLGEEDAGEELAAATAA